MPKISVIIPTYNRARYVTKAIDSALAQTYQDYEIIVVDDGSTDDTRQVLKPYMDRVRYIYQKNAGTSTARNTGIRSAQGEWLAFLDSDDEWMPEKLAVQMDCVSRHPQTASHVTNATIMLPDDKSTDLFTVRGCPDYGTDEGILERPFIDVMKIQFFTPTLLARREAVVKTGGFDESMSIHEDTDLMLRLALEGPWGVSNKCLVKVMRRDEPPQLNLSLQRRQNSAYSYECLVRCWNKMRADSRLFPKEKRLLVRRISGSRFDLGVAQLKVGSRQEGLFSIKQSFRDNPSMKSLIRYVLIRFLGSAGLNLINKKRSFEKNEFRRSDFINAADVV